MAQKLVALIPTPRILTIHTSLLRMHSEQAMLVRRKSFDHRKEPNPALRNLLFHKMLKGKLSCFYLQSIPGVSKKFYAFGRLWNKKYVTDIQTEILNLSPKASLGD